MRKVEKLAAVIVLILLAFVYGHVHKTHAIYDRMIENDQYVMMDVSQDQISQKQRSGFIFRIAKMEKRLRNL